MEPNNVLHTSPEIFGLDVYKRQPYEPEVQFLYLKNSEADLRESFLSFRPEIPVHTSCFSSDSHSTCFWKSGKAIHAGHSHL